MKKVTERTYPSGTRIATVRLEPGERVIVLKADEKGVVVSDDTNCLTFHEKNFYRLGGQVDDVVQGHVLAETRHVYWCSVTQQWVDA